MKYIPLNIRGNNEEEIEIKLLVLKEIIPNSLLFYTNKNKYINSENIYIKTIYLCIQTDCYYDDEYTSVEELFENVIEEYGSVI